MWSLILAAKLSILINVINIPSELTTPESETIVNEALGRLHHEFPQLNFKKQNTVYLGYDPAPIAVSQDDALDRFLALKTWISEQPINHKDLKLIIDHPIINDEQLIYGIACVGCYKKKYQYGGVLEAALKWQTKSGEPRFEHSVLIVMHEILHTLGALHISNGPNLMHPNDLIYVNSDHDKAFKIRTRTRKQVRNYLKQAFNFKLCLPAANNCK